jgi:hypothetical protein
LVENIQMFRCPFEVQPYVVRGSHIFYILREITVVGKKIVFCIIPTNLL